MLGEHMLLSDEERRQQAVDSLHILDTPPDERIDRVTRLAQELFQVPMVSVTLIDRERQWRKSEIGLGGPEAPRKDSFCDATLRRGGSLVIEDASQDSEFSTNPFVAGDPHLRFYAGNALHAPCGEQVGTLCIMDTAPRVLDQRQRGLLQDLSLWVQTEMARQSELDDLAVIQRTLRPRSIPHIPGYTVAAGARSAGDIAGDFHDLHRSDRGLRLTVADVMGKGMGPSIVASAVRAALRTAPDRPLSRAVNETDKLLEEEIGDLNIFVTAFHSELDISTGQLTFVDAGHNLSFVLRTTGDQERIRTDGLPLGMGLETAHQEAQIQLNPGDLFICSSDGLLDLLDLEAGEQEIERLFRDTEPEIAVQQVLTLAEKAKATDDVTVVVVRCDP